MGPDVAKNSGKDYRIESVTDRSQVMNSKTGLYVKRDDTTGRFRSDVLGRSPATGHLVLKPATKGGSVSPAAARAAVRTLVGSHKK